MRAAWLLPLALLACSGGEPGARPTPAPATVTTAPPTPTPTAAATTAGPSPSHRITVAREAHFTTPSKNIGCYVTADGAACDIAEHTWRLPPRPRDCEFDWVGGASVDVANGVVIGRCASDTALGARTVLAYGTGVRVGDFTCVSDRAGVTCRDGGSGGFFLSRTAVREIPYR